MAKSNGKQNALKRYFVVYNLEIPGAWHSGDKNKTDFVDAISPREALQKIWRRERFGKLKHLDYHMEVFANANDYHKNKEPLAQRNKDGDGSISYR